MTTDQEKTDRETHDRIKLSDLIARLVDEAGGTPEAYASDHDRLVAVMGQITRHAWPEANGELVRFGLGPEDVRLRPVLARIDNARIQLTDAIDTIGRMHGEAGKLRAELETTRALNQEMRLELKKQADARAAKDLRMVRRKFDKKGREKRGAKTATMGATVSRKKAAR